MLVKTDAEVEARSRSRSCTRTHSAWTWTQLLLGIGIGAASASLVAASSNETLDLVTTVTTPNATESESLPSSLASRTTLPPKSPPCPLSQSVPLPNGSEQLPDGSLKALASPDLPHGAVFPPGSFWLPAPEQPIRGCVCMIHGSPCLLKCCLWNKHMVGHDCLPVNASTPLFDVVVSAPGRFVLAAGIIPMMPGRSEVRLEVGKKANPLDNFTLLDNGSLWVPAHKQAMYKAGDFCLEVFGDLGSVLALVLRDPEAERDPDIISAIPMIMCIVGLSISLPFLLVTLLVYIILPELRNLHGKTFMCYVGSTTGVYTGLLLGVSSLNTVLNFCLAIGFFMQFSLLACFFWLNVMSFDIWWTFRGSQLAAGGPGSSCDNRRFMWYSLYAWGCPLLVVGVTVTLYLVPGDLPRGLQRPQIGNSQCYLEDFDSKLPFFLVPAGIVIATNVALFADTAWRLAKLKRETATLNTVDSQTHSGADWRRFILYLKLFIMMGLNWVTEVLSQCFDSMKHVMVLFNVFNTLQGIFIFFMFVYKKRVWRLLQSKFSKEQPRHRSSGSGSDCTAASDILLNGNSFHISKRPVKSLSTESKL